ncbi:MAG TPA: hypothetical protein VEN82_03670 [Actinomycetota bacterium]|nr:hypothetical protein [Actinomycetota bacterium]
MTGWEVDMRVRSLVALVAALAVTLSIAAASGAGATPAARAGGVAPITFGSAVVADPVHTFGEPDIRFAPDGTAYVSGPWGTGTQRSIWLRSVDGARTFRPMHDQPMTSATQSDTQITGPGGGDTEISIDRSGKVYYGDLAALLTLKVATWDNSTRTMQTGVIANGDQGLNGFDRQWFAAWDPPTRPAGYTGPLPVNYLIYAEAVAGCCEAAGYSTDGINYTTPTKEYSIGSDGPLAIDQQTGTVLQAVSTTGAADDVGVAVLTRDPSQPNNAALLNAQVVHIANLPSGTTSDTLFPVISMDRARNAYVAWVTRGNGVSVDQDPNAWQVWYSYASASSGWTSWSPPVQINRSPANTNVMPWAVAGSAGRLAVVYYGTDDTADDPSTQDAHQAWNVYANFVTNAASPTPSIQQVQVTRHPSHYGTICLEGLGCIAVTGNRNNADFFEVTVEPRTGALDVVYDDTSNELIQGDLPPPPDGTFDHRGAAVVTIAHQHGGIGLFGKKVTGPPTVRNSLTDPSGDALFDPIYGTTSVPEMDLRGITVQTNGSNLVFTIPVTSLDDLSHGLTATGAASLDYVVRWVGPPVDSPTGVRNPIYYAAVEVNNPAGVRTFYAGTAQSVDLCSVSACFPHVITYPAPPVGTSVSGQLVPGTGTAPDAWQITVPLSAVGNPAPGSLLESLGVYAFAQAHSSATPITNAEAQAGTLPVQVDGICCIDARR